MNTYRKWREVMNDYPRQIEDAAGKARKEAVKKSVDKFAGLEGLKRRGVI